MIETRRAPCIRAVLFDWGDTIMQVFPQYSGPMASWPEVAVIPGAETALASLASHYRVALATNAAESGETLVRLALRRFGLEGHFTAIFTAQELGARKPEPAFFLAAVRQLGCRVDEAVMVGDDYRADVLGARQAGLRAVWFNAAGRPCPAETPQHDAEVRRLVDLPLALASLDEGTGTLS